MISAARPSTILLALTVGCGADPASEGEGSSSSPSTAGDATDDPSVGTGPNTTATSSPGTTTEVDSSGGPSTTDDGSTGAPPPMCTGDDECRPGTHCDLPTGTCRCDPGVAQCLGELPAGHWVELGGTAMQDVFPPEGTVPGSRAAIVLAWSGGVYDRDRHRMVVWGGGHGDYSGNEVYAFDLEALAWSRLNDPSLDVGGDEASGYYPDGLPRSRHTYDYVVYVPELGAMCSAGGAGLWMSGQINVANFDCFDFDTLQWSSRAPTPEGSIGGIADYDPVAGRVAYVAGPGIRYLTDYDVAADVWTTHGDNFTNGGLGYGLTGRVHPGARLFVGVGASAIYTWDLDVPGGVVESTVALADAPPGFDRANPGLDYDASLDRLVWWGGGTSLWSLDLDGMTWVEHPAAPESTVVPPEPVANGTFGRFRYAIADDVFVLVNQTDQNVFARRL